MSATTGQLTAYRITGIKSKVPILLENYYSKESAMLKPRLLCATRRSLIILKKCSFASSSNGEFLEYLKNRIKVAGPISVSTYMQEALTNPKWGYYMKKDVFGSSGDFTTSPEISQMFGEMVGIWLLNEWLQAKQPPNVKLVELGPGRGTLMADILRVFGQFKAINDVLSVHLIEISQAMRQMQSKVLCGIEHQKEGLEVSKSKYNGVNIHWHDKIKDVPVGYTMYVAHEFFDALPVHLFRKTDNGWREVLVDIGNPGLRFVLAPAGNALSELFIPKETTLNEYETSPEAGVIAEHMTNTIADNGGTSLIVDYGKDGPYENSLRSFKDHKLIDNILENPGEADITASVDFSFLKRISNKKVQTFGPVTQANFLKAMGIETRYEVLMRNANEKQRKDLKSAFEFLISDRKMGEKFKVLAMSQRGSSNPAGF